MSDSSRNFATNDPDTRPWWTRLGLDVAGIRRSSWYAPQIRAEIEQVLGHLEPNGFHDERSGASVGVDELAERLDRLAARVEHEAERAEEDRSELRRIEVSERVEAVLTASDADEPVAEGRWAGFTLGEARAWCWNLFQYEPKGFVLPNSFLRERELRNLEEGGLPEVFGYPERAREHADRGLTPRTYREHKRALGATTFSPDLVRVQMGAGFPQD